MPRRLFILILATLLFPHRAYSASDGVVQGVIADDVGGPLPEAHVSLQRRDGSIVKSTESGGMGFYRIELPPGDYTLTASHRGYRPESTRVSVVSGKETTVSIQLRTRTASWQQPGRVQDERELGRHVNERGKQWIEKSERRQADPDPVNNQRTGEVLHDDRACPPGDEQRGRELSEVVAEENHVRAFPSDVGARSHRHPDRCSAQRRRVVDAVSYHRHSLAFPDESLDTREFLVWKQLGINFVDADRIGHNRGHARVVAREQNRSHSELPHRCDCGACFGPDDVCDENLTKEPAVT